MARKLLSVLLVIMLTVGLLPTAASANGVKDLSDGCDILFDGDSWRVFPVENIDDALTAEDLNITVKDREGNIVPEDAYDIAIGDTTGWDDENDMPIVEPNEGPYKIRGGEDTQSGFSSFGAYAVAKDGSGYTGQTRANEFMIWHRYSFNWFGGSISFGGEYKAQSKWYWHDYYRIPEGSIHTPEVRDITNAVVDPSLYTLTYYERSENIPDVDDPDYDKKLYPTDNPLPNMPDQPGRYFAMAESKDPYYGTAWVDFDICPTSGDLSDYSILFDDEDWIDVVLQNRDETVPLDRLKLTVVGPGGVALDEALYDVHIVIHDGWDDELESPIYRELSMPFGLKASNEFYELGFGHFDAYASAKDGSGFTGRTDYYTFEVLDKFSFYDCGAHLDIDWEYSVEGSLAHDEQHNHFAIPQNRVRTDYKVYNPDWELISPELYEITYFRRGTDVPDFEDPEHDEKLYPETDPLDGFPTEQGEYFARIVAKAPYYGTSYIDIDIIEPDGEITDLSDGFEMRFDGKNWTVYTIDDINDAIPLEDMNITVVDKDGRTVPESAYDLVVGVVTGFDEEKWVPIVTPAGSPYGVPDDEESRAEGFCSYGAYAVAKEGSGYTGQVRTQSFQLYHKYSLNYVGCNATFGDEYQKEATSSWHSYFEIPEDKMHAPEVYNVENELVDPDLYTITYFRRGKAEPMGPGQIYSEDEPMKFMPSDPGSYFARIEGKAPYYGTGYVDFDITEATGEDGDFAHGFKLRFNGEEWGDYILSRKDKTLSADDLNITLVRGGSEIIPADKYELHFGYVSGYDEELDGPIIVDTDEPFGLGVMEKSMERGWLMHNVYATAKDGSGFTGRTPLFEFMIVDGHSLDRNFSVIDYGEKYEANFFISWHRCFIIPAYDMHEPKVYDFNGNELDPSLYTLTYFERGEYDENDPDYYDTVYNESERLSEMPRTAGRYFVRIDGKELYYGTSYVDFDIVDFYAVAHGSDTRCYNGGTIVMGKDETIKLRFETDPGLDSMILIPGWFSRDLDTAGFHLAGQPETIDGVSYAVIDTNVMTEPAEGTLTVNWYKLSEVFDPTGGVHWDTARVYYTSEFKIKMQTEMKLLGDVNGDGETDMIDATIIQRAATRVKVPFTEEQLMLGDVDGDGDLTVVDATLIQRYATHIRTAYPIGEPI